MQRAGQGRMHYKFVEQRFLDMSLGSNMSWSSVLSCTRVDGQVMALITVIMVSRLIACRVDLRLHDQIYQGRDQAYFSDSQLLIKYNQNSCDTGRDTTCRSCVPTRNDAFVQGHHVIFLPSAVLAARDGDSAQGRRLPDYYACTITSHAMTAAYPLSSHKNDAIYRPSSRESFYSTQTSTHHEDRHETSLTIPDHFITVR